ncbi:ubiquitin carboxyl-terminal hydrolase [Rhypophila decipiens]
MMVDAPEEHLVQPNGSENDSNVAIINPDAMESDTLLATDHEAMKDLVLPPLADEPPILEDQVHTWTVKEWHNLSKKEHGPIFQAGGYPWRILLFPFGNGCDQASIYLEHGFDPEQVPDSWSCCVQFALVLWNPKDPSLYFHHTAHHRFTKEESDWGFTRFLELRKMFNAGWDNSERPIVEDDTANITAYVRIVEDETGVLWHSLNNYDSKKETGYVGLKNQGATCYLNSLLQSLYFTNAFRVAIYQIPTEHDDRMVNSAYALQRLFYQLQTSNQSVGTNELTKSFGWDSRQIFEQQDVQEFSRKLMEQMENKMKGTPHEKALPDIFSGKVKTYVSCINVEYESSRIEDFWDLQMNVSGNKNLLESFQDYVKLERMDGENRYSAGKHGLQDANKGVIFTSFPDVLHLQLKRFGYDYERDVPTKVNDRYEFPEEFDAGAYLSPDADKSESWEYQLHGVLVHTGDLNTGHYYAFLKPEKDGWWYKYDDDKVTKARKRDVLEENFGGPAKIPDTRSRGLVQKKPPLMRAHNAYMLVYMRKSRLDKILKPVTDDDIPSHLVTRLAEEVAQREARKKEREEQHLYLGVKVITEATFQQHGGTDLTAFDALPEDPAAPRYYRILRTATMKEITATIAKDIGQDPKRVRVWIMVNRQNKTIRPDQPVMDLQPTVEETYSRAAAHRDQALRLWVEVAEEVDANGEAIWPTYQGQANGVVLKSDLILLFLKWFDVESQSLRGVGHLYISKEKKVEDLVPIIMKRMSWGDKLPSDEKIQLWEEIKPNMIEGLKAKMTLKTAELQDGDIICFQRMHERKSRLGLGESKSAEEANKNSDRYEDAREYYDFLIHKKLVSFRAHPGKCDATAYPEFDLELNSKISYDKLAEKVGERLQVIPTHLRFYTISASGMPRAPVKRTVNQSLHTILNPSGYGQINMNQRTNALFFEVLDMSLAELDTKKSIKVILLSEGITKEEQFDILVAKNGQVEDLIAGLIKKAKIASEEEGGRLRIYETNSHKFFRELARDYPVISINDYTTVVAERIPEEELEATESAQYISAFHFQGEPNRAHGMPFRFLIHEDEKFADTKKRLEKRTGLKGKSFEKIKFAVVRKQQYQKPQYLTDDDILWKVANEDDYLGLDHVSRARGNGGGDMFLKG